MNSFSPDELTKFLTSAFQQFADGLTAELEDGLSQIGRDTAAELRLTSPISEEDPRNPDKKPGKYRRGWKVSKDKYRGSFTVSVHNRQYSLVHLLENGHLNRDGTSRSRAFPHVAPAQANAERKVDELLRKL